MGRQQVERLAGQLGWYWDEIFIPRLEGLTDEEYFREPVPDSWNVRPTDAGTFRVEWPSPEPDPPPFTTIAWRMCHIGDLLAERANHHFGDRSYPSFEEIKWPGTARDAVRFVTDGYAHWTEGLGRLSDEDLEEEREGPPNTLDAQFPFAEVILHVNREVIHHGAEVATLRDLYRWSDRSP